LRAAFGGQPGGARKSAGGLNFPEVYRLRSAARQANRVVCTLASPSEKRYFFTEVFS
jgi:hypothetical protein